MSKCGKSFMPECEHFTTGGCISPFNCPYKTEHESITTATSTPLNSNVIYTDETYKDKEIARLTDNNKEYADRIMTAIKILQNSDGFKAQIAINQAIAVLLGNKDDKWKREVD